MMQTLDSFRRSSALFLCCAWPQLRMARLHLHCARQNTVTRNSVGDHSGTIVDTQSFVDIYLHQDYKSSMVMFLLKTAACCDPGDC